MWHFREASYEDTIAESKLGEFFSGSPSQAIIRESFQNSLDAVDNPSQPVRIVVSLGNTNPDEFAEAYGSLGEHWAAADQTLPNAASSRFLLIEDFNTKGLLGPIDKEVEPHGSLYSFWWEEGRSNKRKGSGGSHGVGKSTLSGASNSKAFLALTRRSNAEELLIGYSILPPHRLGSKEYLGYARFGKKIIRPSDNGLVIYPFDNSGDAEIIEAFRKHAQLSRTDERGLSIFIPDARPEITREELLKAIVENFFFPIIKQSLVVEVRDLVAGSSLMIEKANIHSLVETNDFSDQLKTTVEVSLEATRLASKNEFYFLQSDFAFAGDVSLSSESYSEANVKKMQEAFALGQVVSTRLVMPIKLASGQTVLGYADLYARGGANGSKTYKAFRGNILIEREKCRASQPFEVLILDIFNDGDGNELSEYMKYAEDPGHTEWKGSALRRSQGKYASSESWQRHLVQRLGGSFISILSGTENQEQLDSFADDIFYIEKKVDPDAPVAKGGNQGTKAGAENRELPEIPPPAPQLFRIHRLADGKAAVAGTDHLAETLAQSGPVHGKVWAANIIFGTSKSNWRKRHHPTDFDFHEAGMIVADGADVAVLTSNSLEFIARKDDFSIEFDGFDPNRDVYIDVRKKAEVEQ